MARPRLRQDVVDRVQIIWDGDRSLSAAQVHKRIEEELPGQVGVRKVQQLVAKFKAEGVPAFSPTIWHPWRVENWREHGYTSEEVAFLLELESVALLLSGRFLLDHETVWARRLRQALTGLDTDLQMLMVWEYGYRQQIGFALRRPSLSTIDLDTLLGFRPWLTGRRDPYREALERSDDVWPPLVQVIAEFHDQDLMNRFRDQLSADHFITDARQIHEPDVVIPAQRGQPMVDLRSRYPKEAENERFDPA